MDRKVGAGLKRGFEMTRDQIERLKQKPVESLRPDVFEGMTPEQHQRFQDAMNRIKSFEEQPLSPEEQYVRDMPKSESDALQSEFDKGIPLEQLVKKDALRKLQGR